MQINVSEEMKQLRKMLGIDTWGMDLFRLKRRVGEQQMTINDLRNDVGDLIDIVGELEDIVDMMLERELEQADTSVNVDDPEGTWEDYFQSDLQPEDKNELDLRCNCGCGLTEAELAGYVSADEDEVK